MCLHTSELILFMVENDELLVSVEELGKRPERFKDQGNNMPCFEAR